MSTTAETTPESTSARGTAARAEGLSAAEKATLTSGASFYVTKTAGGRAPVRFSDGPNGVRAQHIGGGEDHLGLGTSEPATCFPPASGLAQSWDEDLLTRVGAALGRESRALGVDVLLAPAVNIRRDPRCGRNFEYFSEDPLVAGVLGTAYVQGLQSEGVGSSVKHFAVNNQETDRTRISADVDARALREIYLRAFERIVTQAEPWTVMASYNKLNGVQVAESRWLLHDVLRGEWGFEGTVISDWSAVTDSAASVAAGLDLSMPGKGPRLDDAVLAAHEAGTLDSTALDAAAENVLALLDRAAAERGVADPFDPDASHALAREAAGRSVVLLRNEGGLLPLQAGQRVAVIGTYAAEPRYQGGGSGLVNANRVDIPLEHIRESAGTDRVVFARGFGGEDGTADDLLAEAVEAARGADVALVFLGFDLETESEGFDRDTIELPREQLDVLRAVAAERPETIAVLSHGGVVLLGEVVEHAAAILDGALMGQGVGAGLADVLFGRVNPSGRLTETVPLRLEDAPSFGNFPGENERVEYGESIFVGYRGYDLRRTEVAFPFGHGLSYTSFGYGDVQVRPVEAGLEVTVDVTNTGGRDGREVVQFYVSKPDSRIRRAPRELKAFASVAIAAGATETVTAVIRREDLAYWDVRQDEWIIEGGAYEISAAASSRDVRATAIIAVAGDELKIRLKPSSTLGELMQHPVARELVMPALMGSRDGEADPDERIAEASAAMGSDIMRMIEWTPLNHLDSIGEHDLASRRDRVEGMIDMVNAESASRVGDPLRGI